ncbi:hypothetical protein ACFVBP_10400 [Nocardioides sp. NPDC057764]|uniref:hypothetical protein n=1 Tax=Nocardioides sp. NPDC057764 TaxID=3346243 RepID=UPI003671E047
MTSSSEAPQAAGGVEALPARWRAAAQDPNYTPDAYMPDQYRAAALNRCATDLEAALASREPFVLGSVPGHELEHADPEQQGDSSMPLVEAMDYFDQFWNAHTPAGDWTVVGVDCDCGHCHACGMRSVLSWTHALLSNPALAAHAERLAQKRAEDSRC